MLASPDGVEEDKATPTVTTAGAGTSGVSKHHVVEKIRHKRGKLAFVAPPAPLLISRSHSSIELLPLLYPPSQSSNGLGGGGRDRVMESALVASNATSTMTTTAVPRQNGKPIKNAPRIAKVHRSSSFDFAPLFFRASLSLACGD